MVNSVMSIHLTTNQVLWLFLPTLKPPTDCFQHLAFERLVVPEGTKNLTLPDQVLFLIFVEH